MCNEPLQENYELQLGGMSDSLAAVSLDVEPKAKSYSSPPEVPDSRSAIELGCSSPDSSDSSSEGESDIFSSDGSNSSSPNSSSPNNLQTAAVWDTSSQSDSDVETVILWNPAAKNDCDMVSVDDPKEDSTTQPSIPWDTSSQSGSDADTVIPGEPTAENDADTVSPNNSGSEEFGAVSGDCIQGYPDVKKSDASDSSSDDGSDSSSQDCSDTFSPAGPRSLSPTSSTSSQAALDIDDDDDDDEPTRSKGSHNICAYASPVQDGRRIRTSCDSNDDIGIWHVEPDGFINEAKRVGGPYLCCFPVKMQKLKHDDPLVDILEDYVLLQKIISTLTEHDIHPISMKLRECQSKIDFFNLRPTFIVSATRDTFDDSWILACRQIWRHFSDADLGQVNVEISDPEIYARSLWPVQTSDPVWPVHDELQRRMIAEINLTDTCAIMTVHVGTTQKREKMPLAVLMVVRYQSNRDWRNTRDLIVNILDDLNLPMVGVVITKGQVLRG
ncbi:hypothetical protein PENNAL_c0032G05952 [Penicillium nalgiovense]|uniref:Uncharacterized protein n=2 Tax=Penicillium nalgiovense TaxID=60175 RepID=A0A1V6Y7L5_PENNA|nr:hypothetical protein PENNAL_c0032G05952 [Penicillium nalgiovense]